MLSTVDIFAAGVTTNEENIELQIDGVKPFNPIENIGGDANYGGSICQTDLFESESPKC